MPPCRTCCWTGWSGSCAMPICRRGLAGVVEHYRNGIAALTKTLDAALPKDAAEARAARKKELTDAGVPDDLAGRIASLLELAAAPDLVLVADRTGKPMDIIAATFFAAEAFFRIDRVASRRRAASWCSNT